MTDGRQAGLQSEAESPEPARARKRWLKARYVLLALRKRKARLLVALIALAIIFSGVALFQHWFVHQQVYRTTSQELSSWAEQIADEIAHKGNWDLRGYRQAMISAPGWNVLTRDGLIIDIEGFVPGIFDRIYPPDDSVFKEPTSRQTAVGETWRLFGRRLNDGYVVVGIRLLPTI